jgi:hypothetical protein
VRGVVLGVLAWLAGCCVVAALIEHCEMIGWQGVTFFFECFLCSWPL